MTQGEELVETSSSQAVSTVTVLPVLTPPGGRLRAARELQGLPLDQVVSALRVEKKLLEAMEANRFEVFDAPVYARGYLRQYAKFLGLSVEDMLAEFDGLSSLPVAPTHVPLTSAAPAFRDWSGVKTAAKFALLLLAVLGSLVWWRGHNVNPVSVAVPVAARVVASPVDGPVPMPAKDPVADSANSADTPSAGGPPAGAVDAPSLSPVSSGATPAQPTANPLANPAANAPAEPSVESGSMAVPSVVDAALGAKTQSSVAAGLVIDVRGDSWVGVFSSTGERQVYGMQHAGQSRTISGRGPWRVVLGKADRVRVTFNGQQVTAGPEYRRGDLVSYHIDATGRVY